MTSLLKAYQDFVSGKLERDNDERYVGGVWDYCIERYDDLEKVEKEYNSIWGLFEYLEWVISRTTSIKEKGDEQV